MCIHIIFPVPFLAEALICGGPAMQANAPYALPKVIGIYSPRPQSGKSTVAAFLSDVIARPLGIGIVSIKIADPIKKPLYDMGLTEDHVEGKLKDVPHPQLGGRNPVTR